MDKFLIRLDKAQPQNKSEITEYNHGENECEQDSEAESTSTNICDEEVTVETEKDDTASSSKKKIYKQKFKNSWLMKFGEWLIETEDNEAYCKVCRRVIHGGITHLQRHQNTNITHQRKMIALKSNCTLDINLFKKSQIQTFEKKVKSSELKCTMFIAEHNLAFALLDHLPKFLTNVCPDSEIAKSIKCGRKKGTQLVLQTIAPEQMSLITKDLNSNFFSLIIDEATDISTTKSLVILVRYVENFRIQDKFLSLIEVKDSTAEGLFNTIINVLNNNSININNMLGFAADNASVMQGNKSGVKAKFMERLPHLFVMGCVCHSLHLCAAAASKKIPDCLEEFCKDVVNYFSHSSNRNIKLREFQEFCNTEKHKLLKLSNTRWLSFVKVVDRLLEQWNPLILFFQGEVLIEENSKKARPLLQALQNINNKLYFLYLSYVLDLVTKLNLEFQSEGLKLPMLLQQASAIYKTLLSNFIKPDLIKANQFNLSEVDVRNPRNYCHLDKIYFGAKAELFLAQHNFSPKDIHSFKLNVLEFYIELTTQIKSRIDFKDEVLNLVKLLDPAESANIPSLVPIIKRFPMLSKDIEKLNTEWRLLLSLDEFENNNTNAEEFWKKILTKKNGLDALMFPNLTFFIKGLMCLPHSSAAAERLFSSVTLIKTKQRNRLKIETVNSLLHAKGMLAESSCFNFEPSQSLLTLCLPGGSNRPVNTFCDFFLKL